MIPKLSFPEYTPNFIQAFAGYGYEALARGTNHPIPPTRYDPDQDDTVDVLDDPAYLLACREYDRDLILAMGESIAPMGAEKESVAILGLAIMWPRRMGRMRTWGGQQNIVDQIRDRLDCLRPWCEKKARGRKKLTPEEKAEVDAEDEAEKTEPDTRTWRTIPALDFKSSILGVSGIMPGHAAVNAIDLGFSPDKKKFTLNPWLETLVMVGVEFAPITVIPSEQFRTGQFAVYRAGLWYPFFRRVRIDPYYYAWGVLDDRGLLPHQFTKLIDPDFAPGPFDDLQIPEHLLNNPDMLWNEIERLKRILDRRAVVA